MRWTIVLWAVLLAGCDEPTKPPMTYPDAFVQKDSGIFFLGTCTNDGDCISGRCQAMAGTRRCTKTCEQNDPCPNLVGWSCTASKVCACTGSGKQPDTCGIDGDCDGNPDKESALEVCNGKDDDCNGKVDDVAPGTTGAKLYYPDTDGDGGGDQNKATWKCQEEKGWVTNADDCNDDRADVNKGQVEQCGDGIDHDCDGQKEDFDVCGVVPIVVTDVNDDKLLSGVLKSCGATASVDKSLDIVELVAKQDKTAIKYTVRLAGAPALTSCASYILRLGTFTKVYEMTYIYRPATLACAGLAELEVYQGATKVSSTVKVAFNAADPGHVSFTVPKSEFFPQLSTPTYYLKACTNATADAVKDVTDCAADTCETPVHR